MCECSRRVCSVWTRFKNRHYTAGAKITADRRSRLAAIAHTYARFPPATCFRRSVAELRHGRASAFRFDSFFFCAVLLLLLWLLHTFAEGYTLTSSDKNSFLLINSCALSRSLFICLFRRARARLKATTHFNNLLYDIDVCVCRS